MSGWILGIIGIVFITVLVDVILPAGKTNVFIKSIFSLIFIYVVVSPILKLISDNDIRINDFLEVKQADEMSEHLIIETEYKIQNKLHENGFHNVFVKVDGYSTKNQLIINKINVDLSKLIIINQDEHIDKYKLITDLIISVVDINKEKIIYG